jgi:streptogramin lyase
VAIIAVGKTADWVLLTPGAVWVGGAGPNAVNRIDPKTNRLTDAVLLPGEPCAGLAAGFGALWAPLCGDKPTLARVDLKARKVTSLFKVAGVQAEGGVAVSPNGLWLVTDAKGTLVRIDPATGLVRQTVALPAGSFNPRYAGGVVWVTRVEGSQVTAVDAKTGRILGAAPTGPHPRFLTSGPGAIWTLNQGDGSLTKMWMRHRSAAWTVPLGTPGHGGDIALGGGLIWTTMAGIPLTATDAKTGAVIRQWVGPGGDSLAVGGDAIWLTDYHAGTVARIRLKDALAR